MILHSALMKDCGLEASGTEHKVRVLAGIPAYNEASCVGSVVLQAGQYADEVIVVDDGSTDDTAAVAGLAGAAVIRHGENRGKGSAIQSILAEARKRKPDALVLLDADSQHDPHEIPALIKPVLEGYDLVIGSREAQREKTRAYRRLGQKVLLHATRLASRSNITDSESGFRALSAKAIDELELKENGFAIESEMIASAASKRLRITEVPISNIYVRDGSTLNPVRHGVGVLSRVLVMIARLRPLFFFGVLGAILLAIGIAIGVRVHTIATGSGDPAVAGVVLTALFIIAGLLAVFTGVILNALGRRK